MALISDSDTTLSLLLRCADQTPDNLYAASEARSLTVGELAAEAGQLAAALAALGIKPGDRIAVMLDNSLDYVVLFFALFWLGAIHVPVNTRLRHSSLKFLIDHAHPSMIIGEPEYLQHIKDANCITRSAQLLSHRQERHTPWKIYGTDALCMDSPPLDPNIGSGNDVLFIMYTSGTTGPPKGVLVTDKMLRASTYAATLSADAKKNDVFAIWEPLYHIGATQLLPIPFHTKVTLHFIGSFSASKFWKKIREISATQIHFLGGILQILLRQPADPLDTHHSCRIAWGGGAPVDVRAEFKSRFNIEVRENYGMTEASSLTSINTDGHKTSVGNVAPYFEVRIVDGDDKPVPLGAHGQIIVRERESGLITPGYFDNAEATQNTIRDGWLYTGDLGYLDANNYLYYAGRVKESIRRRGENISAWEIERVVERLDIVEQAAAIGIPDDLGDEEIKLFVKLNRRLDIDESMQQISSWCAQQLPVFQLPRYLEIIEQFPMTGTQRIQKELLSKATRDCFDLSSSSFTDNRG